MYRYARKLKVQLNKLHVYVAYKLYFEIIGTEGTQIIIDGKYLNHSYYSILVNKKEIV